jgi:hypothetical protein
MGKKGAMADVAIPAPYTPPTQIRLTKEQAGDFSIGDQVKISVSGKVVGIRQNKTWDSGKEKVAGYEVELENSSVVNIETNPAMRSLKEMKGS